jgi:alkyl sulfatase BDS1-like metallo-beta-lactamase superfamily hydrolase
MSGMHGGIAGAYGGRMSEFTNVAAAASSRAAGDDLPSDDERDFEAARRGFVVGLAEPQVRAADGRLV